MRQRSGGCSSTAISPAEAARNWAPRRRIAKANPEEPREEDIIAGHEELRSAEVHGSATAINVLLIRCIRRLTGNRRCSTPATTRRL
jgi:hypothetical protein